MPEISYHTIDKSNWGDGPWQNEPEKVQYFDDETGYPCLIKRVDHSGHLCGYVGIGPSHLLYKKSYKDLYDLDIKIHGGLTFSSFCQDMSEETWEKFKLQLEKYRPKAKKYPEGDAANFIQKWQPVIDNYQIWKEKAQSEFICHIPNPSEPDNIWWFGFDCAHVGDYSSMVIQSLGFKGYHSRKEIYRDINYVKQEIKSLALQLQKLEKI